MKKNNLLDNETLNKIVKDDAVDNSDLTAESLEPVEAPDSRSTEQKIKDAFDLIVNDDYSSNHSFYEIKRNIEKKGFVTKQRFKFFKHAFDRFVPLVACLCIAIVVYAFFAVHNGWLTGSSYVESTEMAQNEGYVYEGEDSTVAAAKRYFDGSKSYNNVDIGEKSENGSETSETDNGIDLISVTDGKTSYHLDESPKDFFELWDKLEELGAVPEGVELNSSAIDSSSSNNTVVVLDFNSELQEYTDKQSDTEFLQTIANNFYALNSDYGTFTFTCDESPLTQNGEEVGTFTAK